jgi:hypothetical protein
VPVHFSAVNAQYPTKSVPANGRIFPAREELSLKFKV